MPVKRRKLDEATPTSTAQTPTARNEKPLSAIAAARLRAEAAAKVVAIQETTLEPLAAPSSPPAEVLVSEYEESEAEPEPVPTKRNLKLCNWQSNPRDIFVENESELSISLDKNTTIALIGHFDFRVSRGAININGANIGAVTKDGQKGRTYRACVPATQPILKIRGLDSKNYVQFASCREPTPFAILNPLYEDIWNTGSRGERRRTFGIITSSEDDPLERPLQPQTSPEDWLRAIEDCASGTSTTLVTGSSESGKSTFTRRLVNRYLTGMGRSKPAVPAVCFLDLDPMKPEYSPPGQICLTVVRELNLGPTFTRPVTPAQPSSEENEMVRSHAIPINLVNYRDYYRECIEDLYLAYRNLFSRDSALPLVVRAPTFLYTTQFPDLEQLLSRIRPQNIVHIGNTRVIEPPAAERLHSLQTISKKQRSTLFEITAQLPTLPPLRSAEEIRAMTMQSYFHLTSSPAASTPSWTASPLTTLKPWEFSYRSTPTHTQDIVGFLALTEPLPPSSLLHYLSGSVIHILQSSSAQIPTPYTTLPRTRRSQIPFFPASENLGVTPALDPRTTRVVCAALVRGFDVERGVVQVLVPEAMDEVMSGLKAERTVFAVGCVETPEWAYLEDAYAAQYEEEVGQRKVGSSAGLPVWVEREDVVEGMGYLNTVRRVRKFITGEKDRGDEGKGK
ncbi:Polynucleotide 5'-hydroxyl-kinase grc3 [Curvularia kusanoi]|uniref:Polynucleotide 5'-hydroxyl-kinase GRC3 n=1 Tax=Curvularia kusanoi TaxID=90978 RepID=A0A9P4TGT5_CURKU|nr:Polynucleotide 5'-hydroxyl-kinase grc3 [Curvularia kusanoi]